jgi:small-conductance mechanosensitive channel
MFHDNVLRLGDEIEYSAIKGKVVKIGFRSTWVQAEDDAIVVISNTSLSNGPLTNRTAKTRLAKVLEGTK